MTDGELLEILDKTFHVDSNGFVHYQSAKAWLHYGQLVAAAEREACAKVCEQPIDEIQVTDDCSDIIYMDGLECAAAIRARGEK